MSTFNLGDHLVTNIDILGITEHHGIYIGNDCVIHLTAKNNRVEEDCLYIFSDGNEVRFKKSTATPTQAIARAKAMLGKEGYDLFSNNCEQFVNYCLLGKKTSNQVSNVTHAITHTAARTGLLGAGLSRSAAGAVGVVTITSTGAKIVGEYIGLPDSINTVIGTPGDLVAKPLESIVNGASKTLGSTYDNLCEGEILDAGESLIVGVIETTGDVVVSVVDVVGDFFTALGSWFD